MNALLLIALAATLTLLVTRPSLRRWLWWRVARNEARRFSSGRALCPACARRLPLHRHFCFWCHAPVSGFAATGPIQRVAATGELYRRAVSHPSALAVVGLWLLASPALLALVAALRLLPEGPGAGVSAALFAALLPVAIALKATIRFLRPAEPNTPTNA